MHWRTQFPPQRPSVLAELMAVFRSSLRPETVMATALPDELPPAPEKDTLAAETAPVAN